MRTSKDDGITPPNVPGLKPPSAVPLPFGADVQQSPASDKRRVVTALRWPRGVWNPDSSLQPHVRRGALLPERPVADVAIDHRPAGPAALAPRSGAPPAAAVVPTPERREWPE
jgi:hypothetical protein